MRVRGTLTETLIIQKEVEVEVDEDADEDTIQQAVRDKAYEKTILDGDHGWEGVDTLDVNIEWERCLHCPGCQTVIESTDDQCPKCGYFFPCCSL